MYQEAADIRDVYLYKNTRYASEVLVHGVGTMFYRHKIKGVSAYNTQIKYIIANEKLRQSSTFW